MAVPKLTKILMPLVVLMSYIDVLRCQEWTWLTGEDLADKPSTISSPGGRSGSYMWKDLNGHVWLFGGKGYSDVNKDTPTLLNDLWKYNIESNTWILVNPGTVHSTADTSPDSSVPAPRYSGSACGVTNLTFAIFGGIGENEEMLGDTWVFYSKRQTWLLVDWLQNDSSLLTDSYNTTDFNSLNLNSSIDLNKTESLMNSTNNVYSSPSRRGNLVSWCLYDSILVFSGIGNNKTLLNDMWKFSFRNLTWSEISSANTTSRSGKDVEKLSPLPRSGATTWVDNAEVLFMFGGNTIPNTRFHSTVGYLSDLWKLNLTSYTWMLLKGTEALQRSGVYGKMYSPESENIPGSRQGGVGWVDSFNNLWLFGGDGMDRHPPSAFSQSKLLSDLWQFRVKDLKWSWMGGSSSGEAEVKFSQKGETTREALVGGRCEASAWVGTSEQFYLFGGLGHDGQQKDGYLNDLWLLDTSDLLYHSGKFTFGTVILFTLLTFSVVLVVAAVSLYARDTNGTFHRFDKNIKYTHLSTTGD